MIYFLCFKLNHQNLNIYFSDSINSILKDYLINFAKATTKDR